MGKRYYCDFCERSFADNAENRKKHLNGVQHQKMKKLHYDSFRDAATILADEMGKKPCKRFHQSGQCDFDTSCKFSHMTNEEFNRLRNQVEADKARYSASAWPSDRTSKLETWLRKRAQRISASATNDPSDSTKSFDDWTLPAELQVLPNLPPSVIPPSPVEFVDQTLNEWGLN